MPFALLIIGVMLLVASVRGTQDQLFTLVQGDFTGQPSFVIWFVAILLIGAIGYIPKLKSVSVAFLVLITVVLVLTKGNPGNAGGGFFQQFSTAVTAPTVSQVPISQQLPGIPGLGTVLATPTFAP